MKKPLTKKCPACRGLLGFMGRRWIHAEPNTDSVDGYYHAVETTCSYCGPSIEALKNDIEAARKAAQEAETRAATCWKRKTELEKELQKLENVEKFRKELFEEKL